MREEKRLQDKRAFWSDEDVERGRLLGLGACLGPDVVQGLSVYAHGSGRALRRRAFTFDAGLGSLGRLVEPVHKTLGLIRGPLGGAGKLHVHGGRLALLPGLVLGFALLGKARPVFRLQFLEGGDDLPGAVEPFPKRAYRHGRNGNTPLAETCAQCFHSILAGKRDLRFLCLKARFPDTAPSHCLGACGAARLRPSSRRNGRESRSIQPDRFLRSNYHKHITTLILAGSSSFCQVSSTARLRMNAPPKEDQAQGLGCALNP